MSIIQLLQETTKTEDGRLACTLSIIAGAMIIDFLTGTIAAKINPDIDFRSKEGINGILRKVVSIIVLVFLVPVSVLIPNGAGIALIWTLYLGYLGMEITSIFENLKKMDVVIPGIHQIIKYFKKDEEEK